MEKSLESCIELELMACIYIHFRALAKGALCMFTSKILGWLFEEYGILLGYCSMKRSLKLISKGFS